MTVHDIAVVRGDGVGPEVVDAALAVLGPVSEGFGFDIGVTEVDAGADTYLRTGSALPGWGLDALRGASAVLKGPVGLPSARLPDGTDAGSLGGLLRDGLGLYAAVRPVRPLPGGGGRSAAVGGNVDYVVVSEEAQGPARLANGPADGGGAAQDTLRATRADCARIAHFAFRLARQRSAVHDGRTGRVTCADRADALHSMRLFREVFLDVAADYPDVQAECLYAGAAAQALVATPGHFDVVVADGLLGDVIAGLGSGTAGGAALCPAGFIGAGGAYFEPLHGSEPALAGAGAANPIGQILAAAMMLDHLGEPHAAEAVRAAVASALRWGAVRVEDGIRASGGPAAVAAAVVHELGRR
jgi:isocitrate/isopropylmalate dehydrogenase